MKKVGVVILCVALLVAAAVVYKGFNGFSNTNEILDLLLDRYKSAGVFLDYDRTVGVESVEDVTWSYDDGTWYVKFGKLEFELTPEQLVDPTILAKLEKLGMDIRGSLESGDLSFYWLGEELEQCIPD